MVNIAKILIIIGGIFLVLGGVVFLGQKIGIHRLPGDIILKRGNFTFYFPLGTCILISIFLTLLLTLLFRK